MRILFTLLMILSLFANTAAAEVSSQRNYNTQTISAVSDVAFNYDSDMKLSFRFEKSLNLSNLNEAPEYTLSIDFDPITDNKPMKRYEFFKDGFAYLLDGDKTPRRGAFVTVSDPGVGQSNLRTNVTVNEIRPGKYTATASGDTFYYGGHFYTHYGKGTLYLKKYKMNPFETAFLDDLLFAAKNNKEITFLLPYAADLSNVDKIEFVKFKIDKMQIAEWNAVYNYDLKSLALTPIPPASS